VIFNPRPYQVEIINKIVSTPRCNIWAGMGLGKTVSTLTALKTLYDLGELVRPTLVLAPLRVARSTWVDEVGKWDHLKDLRVSPIIGTPQQRAKALSTPADIYTINYDNIPWLIEQGWNFDCVVADESTKLKGHRARQGGKRTQALAKVAHKTRRWVNLTGTPSPNGLEDLWGQNWFVDQGAALGRTFTQFSLKYFTVGYDGYSLKAKPTAHADIKTALAPSSLSLDAKDHFDLKDPIEVIVGVDLPKKAYDIYTDMVCDFSAEVANQAVTAVNAAVKSAKLLQIANGVVYSEGGAEIEIHQAKLEALDSIIAECSGAPILLAYHFKSDFTRLQKRYPTAKVLDKNPETIRQWNRGEIPLLLAHPASAGHGLNLQDGGNILVFFSHDWNLETYLQMIERIGTTRQAQAGHDRPVFLYYIVAKNTIDEIVLARRKTKKSVQDALLEGLKCQ